MSLEKNVVIGAIMGAIIGDSLGVPYEFLPKNKIGTSALKPANWSDDTSMILCTITSLVELKRLSTKDMADKYVKWLYKGYLTPHGKVLDCGRTTQKALKLYKVTGVPTGIEKSCSNGSLMRIIPLLFYLHKHKENRYNTIKEFSSITHSNMLCIMGCDMYIELGLNLLEGFDRREAYLRMKQPILDRYRNYQKELYQYYRILHQDITELDIDRLNGTEHIVDTLECSFYSFLTCKNYKDSIIRAISFGDDTDTVACITGGLSGLYYGYNNIPSEYIEKLSRKKDILYLLDKFYSLYE